MLTVYLGATLTFFTLSAMNVASASFYARLLSSYGCLLLCATYGLIASILLRLVGAHRNAQWATARAFRYTMGLTTGVYFEIVEGKQHLDTRPCVLIGNHQSELDVLLLGAIFPPYCSVTAKSSLAKVPFLGWFMALSGTVFIDRKNRDTAVKAFEDAAIEMKRERQTVFIFPEGTRSYASGPEMGDFKKGAFHLAVQAGMPIVPVVCANYWGVLSVKEKRFRRGRIPVKGESTISSTCLRCSIYYVEVAADIDPSVLPPIPTAHLTAADVEELTQNTRENMLTELVKLTESPLGQMATKAHVGAAEEDLAELATSGANANKKER